MYIMRIFILVVRERERGRGRVEKMDGWMEQRGREFDPGPVPYFRGD